MEGFVDGYKAVTSVDEASVGLASRAEVPVWAVEALMANTVDVLVTTITDGIVSNITARGKKSLGNDVELGVLDSWLESVLGVVAMLHTDMASDAKVVVGACSAGNEVLLGKLLNARVAGAGSNWNLQIRDSLLDRLDFRRHGLSRAVDDFSVLHDTLEKPMVLALAENSIVNAGLAEIKVTILASAAVVVNIRDRSVAVVAVNGEYADSLGRGWAVATLTGEGRKLCEPLVTGSSTTSDWNLGARAGIHSGSLLVMIHACSIAMDIALRLGWTTARRVDDRRESTAGDWAWDRDLAGAFDEQILESALKFCDGTCEGSLFGIVDCRRSLRSWGCGLNEGLSDGLTLDNWADWGRLLFFVFNGSWLRCNRLLILDGHLETKLELCLRSTIELLVDGGIVCVEDDEGCGTVGIALEDGFGGGWDRKEESKLIGKSARIQVLERELESTVGTLDIDLQCDQSVLVRSGGRRHGCYDQGVDSSAYKALVDTKDNCCDDRVRSRWCGGSILVMMEGRDRWWEVGRG